MNQALEVLNAELGLARKQVSRALEAIQDNKTQIHETTLHMNEWLRKVDELEKAIQKLSEEK